MAGDALWSKGESSVYFFKIGEILELMRMIEWNGEVNHVEPGTAVGMSFGKRESVGSHMGGDGLRYSINCSSDYSRRWSVWMEVMQLA